MPTKTTCLLLAVLALYALVQSVVNYRAFGESCESASVATFFNLINFVVALLCLMLSGWCAARGDASS